MGKKELDFELSLARGFGGFQLLENLGGSLMDFSETPLTFKKNEIVQVFSTLDQLIDTLAMRYVR
jgi:hypothetical protein